MLPNIADAYNLKASFAGELVEADEKPEFSVGYDSAIRLRQMKWPLAFIAQVDPAPEGCTWEYKIYGNYYDASNPPIVATFRHDGASEAIITFDASAYTDEQGNILPGVVVADGDMQYYRLLWWYDKETQGLRWNDECVDSNEHEWGGFSREAVSVA